MWHALRHVSLVPPHRLPALPAFPHYSRRCISMELLARQTALLLSTITIPTLSAHHVPIIVRCVLRPLFAPRAPIAPSSSTLPVLLHVLRDLWELVLSVGHALMTVELALAAPISVSPVFLEHIFSIPPNLAWLLVLRDYSSTVWLKVAWGAVPAV